MSGDEFLVTFASLGFAAYAAWAWYTRLTPVVNAPYPGQWRTWLGLAPAAALAGVLVALLTLAADDVRTAPIYILMYLCFGAAWVFLATQAMALVGISVRDDAVERRNAAAAIVSICAMLSFAIIFSGANIGNGPGWWVVLITGTLATASWFILWGAIEKFVDAHERITVGRETAAAIRLGGVMLAMAIVLARGAAGDWVSFADTLRDFAVAWPAPALAAVSIVIERSITKSVHADRGIAIFLAIAYIAFAGYAVWSSPELSHNPNYPPPPSGQYELQ